MNIYITSPMSRFTLICLAILAAMASGVFRAAAAEDVLIALLAPRTEARDLPPQQELRIEKAVYGDLPEGAQTDVTEMVAGMVTDGALAIRVSNTLFGDPAQGVVKQLQVTYVLGDQRHSATVGENQELRLGRARDGKPEAEWREKFEACNRLRRVGTERSVPVLMALLQDDSLFDAALDALEVLPFPEVDKGLRAVLGDLQGRKRIGVMQALGARRDVHAVASLAAALRDPDPEVIAAAMGALGRIGTPQAAEVLLSLIDGLDETMRSALAEGLLVAGAQLNEERHPTLAGRIGRELRKADWPEHVRLAAFQVLVLADQGQSAPMLLEALHSGDPVFRGIGALIIAETAEEASFPRYAAAMGGVPAHGQLALINALADTRRRAGRPVVIQGLLSAEAAVQIAAAGAMGPLGTGADVPPLVALVRHENSALAEAARESLVQLRDHDVETRLVDAMAGADPEVYTVLLHVLARRGSDQTLPLTLRALRDDHVETRRAALQTLADRGEKEHAPTLLKALMAATDDAERQAAGRCLTAFSSRFGAAILPALREALPEAGPQDGSIMLVALSRIGGADALAVVLPMLRHTETSLRETAERVLVGWPDLAAAPHLLTLADAEQVERRTAALRGYVRLARMEPSAERRAQMLVSAMEKAGRPEEKWPILSAWGTVHTVDALARLSPYLQDEATRNEAASALLAVAREVMKRDENQKVHVIDALKKVSDLLADQPIGTQARELLRLLQNPPQRGA